MWEEAARGRGGILKKGISQHGEFSRDPEPKNMKPGDRKNWKKETDYPLGVKDRGKFEFSTRKEGIMPVSKKLGDDIPAKNEREKMATPTEAAKRIKKGGRNACTPNRLTKKGLEGEFLERKRNLGRRPRDVWDSFGQVHSVLQHTSGEKKSPEKRVLWD